MTLTKQTDQVEQALALLLNQFKGKPGIEGLLTAFMNQVQEIEDMLFDLYLLRSLDSATDAQLDGIGRILLCVRDGRSDVDYRARLRVQVLINETSCTIPEIAAIASQLVADTYSLSICATNNGSGTGTYHGPEGVYLDFNRDDGGSPTPLAVAKLLRRFIAAGVRAVVAWDDSSNAAGGAAFSLGPDPDADGNSVGLGDATGATGGMFIRASDGETPETLT